MQKKTMCGTILAAGTAFYAWAHQEYEAAMYGRDAWQNRVKWLTGDMNTSVIRTARGRTIMMQVDMSTPRPYSRINLIQGTKGCLKVRGAKSSWGQTPLAVLFLRSIAAIMVR